MSIQSLMVKLAENLVDLEGDKPATHARAKEMVALAQSLIKATQPGIGEFKWTVTARKDLTKSANTKKGNPSLIVARGDGSNVWHTTGHYAVKGEPSKRFEPCDYTDLPIAQMMAVIPSDPGEEVTVIGSTDKTPIPDCVELSNGQVVQRVFLAYVTATLGGVVRLHSQGGTNPVSVRVGGETMGLIMPIRVN